MLRFIPAWAGNTGRASRAPDRASVHPRVGGEHCLAKGTELPTNGSSPRGRGTPLPLPALPALPRFIPAWAGNTVARIRAIMTFAVHPRVGGEHFQQLDVT